MITLIVITIVSLLLSAVFSGIEIAYVTSDRVRVELDVKKGGPISRILNIFYHRPDFFISTILVGNNIVLVIYGMGAAGLLTPWLTDVFGDNEFLILLSQTLISTAVILLIGEFLPKTTFRINPNASLKLFALPVMFLYMLLYPISLLTTAISKGLMRICGIRNKATSHGLLTVGDLNQYIERTIDHTEDENREVENEVKIFHNALDFSSTHIRDCMIPRNEIVAVDIDTTSRESLSHLFTASGRSKIIVYREDIDNILGYIHVSELFDPQADWTQHLKEVVYAPETLLANKMMRRLMAEKRSIAIVVDEFGGTAGMVTLEDLVEEILGDIQDEHDKSQVLGKVLPDGSIEFSGRAEIEHINETFDLDIPEDDEYQTIAGYILNQTGTIPGQGEVIILGDYRFEIVKKSATRLETIVLTKLTPQTEHQE